MKLLLSLYWPTLFILILNLYVKVSILTKLIHSKFHLLPRISQNYIGTYLIIIALTIYIGQINAQVEGGITCYTPETQTSSSVVSCTDLTNFIPTESTPILTVHIAFHVIQRAAPLSKGNFDENDQDDVDFLNAVYDRLNDLYEFGQEQWCNCGWVETNQIRDSRIRFELDGIYYHRDNVGYVNNSGNYYDSYNFDHYATCAGSNVLNIFFSNPPLNTASGYGPGNYVGMFNWYNEYIQGNTNPWGTGNLLGHEIGHVFGLNHSFCSAGRLSDMCQSEALQSCMDGPFCANTTGDCTCGNNFMSYSRLADYISELQMATMRRKIITSEDRSKYLRLDLEQTPIVIDQSGVEWEEARIVHDDIYIMPGASLTISCRLVMPDNARIVVRRGARLIVDGGWITSKGPTAKDCNNDQVVEYTRWQGIEVWGHTSVATTKAMLSETYQLQSTDPGVVILKNNAIIEHAKVGIFPQQRGTSWEDQLEHFGGLISANNAEFRDCWKGVEYISNSPLRSSSQFVNTRFKQTYLNTTLPFPLKTDFHGLSSWQVKGLYFSDCDFIGLTTGITVLNADFTIEESLFQLTGRGIYIGTTTPGLSLNAQIGDLTFGNVFESCDYPISIFGYDRAIIDDNLIKSSPFGIYVEGGSQTIIQRNELQNSTLNGNTNIPVLGDGIYLTQTGEGIRNLIRCNQFTGTNGTLVRDGIFVYGDNRTTIFHDNEFRCKYDVKIEQYDEDGQPLILGRLPSQNLGSNSFPISPYNKFTLFTTDTHNSEIHTPDPFTPNGPLTETFRYFHPTGTCSDPGADPPVTGSAYIPLRPIHGTCTDASPFNFINSIGSHASLFNCDVIRPILVFNAECKTVQCLDSLYTKVSQHKAIIDVGDLGSLYSNIQSSPNSTTTINALNSASPWLSDGVLHAVLVSTMTESNKRSILAQNTPLPPHILAQAEQTLSTQVYNYLAGLNTTKISARDSVQLNLTSLINYKDALLRYVVDSLTAEEEYAEADDLLEADGGRYASETRVGLKISQGNLTNARQMINNWPDTESPDIEFSKVLTMYLDYAIDGELPSTSDSASLMDIAFDSPNQASRAKSLAGAFYGIFFDPLLPPEEPQAFSMPIASYPTSETFDLINTEFVVYPNPTSENINIVFNNDEITKGKNIITNVSGSAPYNSDNRLLS